MPGWVSILFGAMAAIMIVAALAEAWLKRNRHRPLSHMRPDLKKTGGELGLEARQAEEERETEPENTRLRAWQEKTTRQI